MKNNQSHATLNNNNNQFIKFICVIQICNFNASIEFENVNSPIDNYEIFGQGSMKDKELNKEV